MTEIDRIDRKILCELSRDARQTNLKLAERVGLSPSACLRRVQELERAGIITGYRAVIDRSRLGAGFVVYVAVGLSNHTKASLEAFECAISLSGDVVEFHTVTGAVEYLLRVEVADIKAYKAFHTDVLGTLPHVSSITSYIVMDSPKSERD
ncbi:DNA-binding transcriptional regulator, Lrp family [Pseudomonas arsenicoxydans]|uniref:Leucine-responsive regulatory protein n=1 Tax=Pseudomonas arsenicoxydans TaxID=702115 RepID=A0A1H0KSC3_9PSED|nr:Lrp/AsnC family transcriptional regulator [Pseudomonas arsenicoxydans]SDO58686.1 DNA-binding transcriptional regulator, Lrp family [Pseudomonas arsenicoxydans]